MCWGKHYVAKVSGFKAMKCIGSECVGQRRCPVGRFSFWFERETNVHGAPHSFHFEEFQAKMMHRETAVIMHKINGENVRGNGMKIFSIAIWNDKARTRRTCDESNDEEYAAYGHSSGGNAQESTAS